MAGLMAGQSSSSLLGLVISRPPDRLVHYRSAVPLLLVRTGALNKGKKTLWVSLPGAFTPT